MITPKHMKNGRKYLDEFELSQPLKNLPKTSSDQEKFFITGKNIYTTYYNTRNLELIYQKHLIRAPIRWYPNLSRGGGWYRHSDRSATRRIH